MKLVLLMTSIFCLISFITLGQSSIEIQPGSILEVTAGADICADNIIINGTFSGAGTTCKNQTPNIYSDTEPVSLGIPVYFNEGGTHPGDGHTITMNFTSLSGSGNVTVVQTNTYPSNSPCSNVCNLHWDISKEESITSFSTNISFSYLDADVAGCTESPAYLGIAKFNESTNSWQWLGGTVDADNNTITVNGLSSYSTFALYCRIFGDCTADGYVDAADLQRLGDCWHSTNSGEFSDGCDARFFNYNKNTNGGNQIIDAADLQVFGDCWHNGIK